MTATLPAWLGWLLIFAVLLTFLITWSVLRSVGAMRQAMAEATGTRPRSRQELEEWYTAGRVDREAYERWKNRVT